MKVLISFLLLVFFSITTFAQKGTLSVSFKSEDAIAFEYGEIKITTPSSDQLNFETDVNGLFQMEFESGLYTLYFEKKLFKDTFQFKISPSKTNNLQRVLQAVIVNKKQNKSSPERTTEHVFKKSKSDSRKKEKSIRSESYDEFEIMTSEFSSVPVMAEGDYIHDYSVTKTSKMRVTEEISAGTLTAGELNDFSKWELWTDIESTDLENYYKIWNIYPQHRFCVQVQNHEDYPVVNASVKLYNGDELIFESRTDNTGKAELWSNLFKDKTKTNYQILISKNEVDKWIKKPFPFSKGINFAMISTNCTSSKNVDIAFIVDATGSMGDEIKYLQLELLDVIDRIRNQNKTLNIQTGSVFFYRDHTDAYLTKMSPMTSDVIKTSEFIKNQFAAGGGDGPEAVDEALWITSKFLNWRDETRTKIAFLILDAPPHQNQSELDKIEKAVKLASKKGIRIIPIVGSSINKSTEYLMRSIALATNGTYTFLTDDSGIGGSHLKPTTDDYQVEKLNDLMVRLITQYTSVSECNNTLYENTAIIDSTLEVKGQIDINISYYPNPTKGIVNIQSDSPINELYISDLSGKSIANLGGNPNTFWKYNLSNYPTGIYLIRYYDKNKERWYSKKFILIK
tara:strand:+ start:18130 stop:20001 length:1872 start_codon:yes stop_codon:yes gene_type:complete